MRKLELMLVLARLATTRKPSAWPTGMRTHRVIRHALRCRWLRPEQCHAANAGFKADYLLNSAAVLRQAIAHGYCDACALAHDANCILS